MKRKKFDCVEMKRKAQERLRREYEARKGEFASYVDFLNKTAEESPFIRRFMTRVRRAKEKASRAT